MTSLRKRQCVLLDLAILFFFVNGVDLVVASSFSIGASNKKGAISPAITGTRHKKHHTRLTGFGSRSITKSIFANEKVTPFKDGNKNILSVHQDEGGKLWFQSKPNKKNVHNVTTICVSVTPNGNLDAQVCSDKEKFPSKSAWIPIEGIYGVYQVPSGMICALITSSQEKHSARFQQQKWWQIRRVHSMELVHLRHDGQTTISQRQLKEERRQLKLLRQSLRHHDFYYLVPSSSTSSPTRILDITQTLQRSFEAMQFHNSTNPTPWWTTTSPNHAHRPDSRFFWNEPAIQPLLGPVKDRHSSNPYSTLMQHVIPVTSAFVGIQTNVSLTDSTAYDEILVSRRSRFRAGTRFTKRGADGTGAVANYAETEQICLLYDKERDDTNTLKGVMSHIQTRGSIPLRWSSPADVKTYRPRVRIGTDPLAQARAVRSHILEQWSLYAKSTTPLPKDPQMVFVNLIDKKADQGRLGRAFDAVLQAVLDVYVAGSTSHGTEAIEDDTPTSDDTPGNSKQSDNSTRWTIPPKMIRHVWFDFHAECKGGRWDRLKNLLKDVSSALDEQGYFCAVPPSDKDDESHWKVVRRQRGVIRTNCMDCLDRTNVVQSIFGRHVLFRQLYEQPGSSTEVEASKARRKKTLPLQYASGFRRSPLTLPWSAGEVSHRLLWADNADAISRLYAGTPALKGDFTRTGKRTKRGALDDGMNSLQRYYLNNFLDADRQEGMDLLTGYADFALVYDDILEETDDVGHNGGILSIQDTARALLLGGTTNLGYSKEPHKETKPKRHRRQGLDDNHGSGPRPLELRWLPGDLQSHMRSQAAALGDPAIEKSSSTLTNEVFSAADALEAIDRRAATDQPWWVTTDSSDDENNTVSKEQLGASSANAGHLIGGVVAAIQMPIATAVAVVCMIFPGVMAQTGNGREGENGSE